VLLVTVSAQPSVNSAAPPGSFTWGTRLSPQNGIVSSTFEAGASARSSPLSSVSARLDSIARSVGYPLPPTVATRLLAFRVSIGPFDWPVSCRLQRLSVSPCFPIRVMCLFRGTATGESPTTALSLRTIVASRSQLGCEFATGGRAMPRRCPDRGVSLCETRAS